MPPQNNSNTSELVRLFLEDLPDVSRIIEKSKSAILASRIAVGALKTKDDPVKFKNNPVRIKAEKEYSFHIEKMLNAIVCFVLVSSLIPLTSLLLLGSLSRPQGLCLSGDSAVPLRGTAAGQVLNGPSRFLPEDWDELSRLCSVGHRLVAVCDL